MLSDQIRHTLMLAELLLVILCIPIPLKILGWKLKKPKGLLDDRMRYIAFLHLIDLPYQFSFREYMAPPVSFIDLLLGSYEQRLILRVVILQIFESMYCQVSCLTLKN